MSERRTAATRSSGRDPFIGGPEPLAGCDPRMNVGRLVAKLGKFHASAAAEHRECAICQGKAIGCSSSRTPRKGARRRLCVTFVYLLRGGGENGDRIGGDFGCSMRTNNRCAAFVCNSN